MYDYTFVWKEIKCFGELLSKLLGYHVPDEIYHYWMIEIHLEAVNEPQLNLNFQSEKSRFL